MKIPVRIQIAWLQSNIIGLWLNDREILRDQAMNEVVPDHNTELIMPFPEATKLMGFIINGMACGRMEELLKQIKIKLTEARKLQIEQDKNFEDVEDW